MKQISIEQLDKVIEKKDILLDESMKNHTTFCVGGKAACFLMPRSEEQLIRVMQILRENKEKYYILGHGSNLLVSDSGFDGCIVQIDSNISSVTVNNTVVKAAAGVLLSQIASDACKNGLSGMEFASGIPGTLGGAVVMNAGAYGGEMSQIIQTVEALTNEGDIVKLDCKEMEFNYRSSIVRKKSYIVLSAEIILQRDSIDEINARMEELRVKRAEKQPLEYPSAGSTFKRPVGHYTGKLIADAGLRGYRIGGAQISEKHCGFLINRGDATAADILNLINHVKATVFRENGVLLEPEVCLLGNF